MVKRFTGTKAEARALRDELRRQYELGISAESASMLFSDFAQSWYETRVANGELSKHTLQNDCASVKLLKRHLGKARLNEITPQMVEALYLKIRKEKSAALGHSVSNTTMHTYHHPGENPPNIKNSAAEICR